MATVGRPAKPVEQKRRLGNPGKRALPEPASVAALPALVDETPASLGEAGRELWTAVTAAGKAWLAPSDHPMLQMLCELADRRETFLQSLAVHGPLIERPGDGHLVANPVGAMLATTEKQMVHIAASLGLTPADRSRLGVAEVKARNAFEEMLARRQRWE